MRLRYLSGPHNVARRVLVLGFRVWGLQPMSEFKRIGGLKHVFAIHPRLKRKCWPTKLICEELNLTVRFWVPTSPPLCISLRKIVENKQACLTSVKASKLSTFGRCGRGVVRRSHDEMVMRFLGSLVQAVMSVNPKPRENVTLVVVR